MANDLIEIKADKNELMINIKNIFLNEFLKNKLYNEQEKKYINDNIIFLKKEVDIFFSFLNYMIKVNFLN